MLGSKALATFENPLSSLSHYPRVSSLLGGPLHHHLLVWLSPHLESTLVNHWGWEILEKLEVESESLWGGEEEGLPGNSGK